MSQPNAFASIIPKNDSERLKKLYSYEILDTPAEITFEKIAALAAMIFNSPVAQINFVDQDRVFFKSNISELNLKEVPRADSFCSRAILSDKVTLYNDTLNVPFLVGNKFVAENGVRFYAGAPLKTREGLRLGTVCVLDTEPREVTAEQIKMLEFLSGIVIDELELRKTARTVVRVQTDMINRVVHDLKNPSTTIKLSAELIKMKVADPTTVISLAGRIISASESVLNNLNNLLDLSQAEDGHMALNIVPVGLNEALTTLKNNFSLIAANKDQVIELMLTNDVDVIADPIRLQEILENLLSNALKFSPRQSTVSIHTNIEATHATVEVRDAGPGLTPEDKEKLFTKFAQMSAVPTGKEHSNGLGLFLVKTLIELHKGTTWATSEGKEKGSSFFISLPIYTPI